MLVELFHNCFLFLYYIHIFCGDTQIGIAAMQASSKTFLASSKRFDHPLFLLGSATSAVWRMHLLLFPTMLSKHACAQQIRIYEA